ncbi:DUF397 domain-containing protein [Saccharothrix isguenensis]
MTTPRFRKSSYSGDADCVEVALGPNLALLRDSKNQEAGQLRFSVDSFRSFTKHLRAS